MPREFLQWKNWTPLLLLPKCSSSVVILILKTVLNWLMRSARLFLYLGLDWLHLPFCRWHGRLDWSNRPLGIQDLCISFEAHILLRIITANIKTYLLFRIGVFNAKIVQMYTLLFEIVLLFECSVRRDLCFVSLKLTKMFWLMSFC